MQKWAPYNGNERRGIEGQGSNQAVRQEARLDKDKFTNDGTHKGYNNNIDDKHVGETKMTSLYSIGGGCIGSRRIL